MYERECVIDNQKGSQWRQEVVSNSASVLLIILIFGILVLLFLLFKSSVDIPLGL